MYLDFGTGLLMACDLKFATLATAPEPVRPTLITAQLGVISTLITLTLMKSHD